MSKRLKSWGGVLVLVAAALIVATSALAQTESPASPSPTSEVESDILAAINSGRVQSLDSSASTAQVSGVASTLPGDATRTLWYETVAGAALAHANGLDEVRRVVLDSSGTILDTESDPKAAAGVQQDPFASTTLSQSELDEIIRSNANALDMSVIDIHYIALYGGAAEVVVQPAELGATLAAAGSVSRTLIGELGDQSHPYLITIVDKDGSPQLILGFSPGVGGDTGQGLAWAAPGVRTNAIIGEPLQA